jgi:hypothetical protein
VILTGALADHGIDHRGVPAGERSTSPLFSKGSFEGNIGKLGAKLLFPTDPKTCASAGTATAPVTIVDGSGACRGDPGNAANDRQRSVDRLAARGRSVQKRR